MVKAWAESLYGVVASEETLASSVGSLVLTQGGNAVDAAVATSMSLAVLIPHLGGFGGDFFMLYRSPGGRVYFINGSGQAPGGLLDEVKRRGLASLPERGPLTLVVPGMLGGLYEAWRRFGSMEWRDLVRPAWLLASRGFPLPPSTARALERLEACLSSDPGSRESLLRRLPRGSGAPAAMPGLAALLEGVMEDPLYLYRGEPAEAIEEYISSVGGVLNSSDLRAYKPLEDEPLQSTYRGWRVYEMPPNTQGITTLHILMDLEDSKLPDNPFDPSRIDLLYRAALKAYRVRDEYVGDPNYMRYSAWSMLERSTYSRLAPSVDPVGGGSGDTTFYAVADGEGGLLAGIQSLYYPFGSCVTEPKFQITFNNRALGFTLEGDKPNSLRPGARPLHTLSAVIMEGEGRAIALGASGGLLRPQQHALFVTNIVDYRMGVLDAINAPRALWDPGRGSIICESGFNCREGWVRVERIGVANAAEVKGWVKRGYTDERGDGVPTPGLKHIAG